jgi:hypothetical protein
MSAKNQFATASRPCKTKSMHNIESRLNIALPCPALNAEKAIHENLAMTDKVI